MRIVVHLPSPVRIWRPSEQQLATLARRLPRHSFHAVASECEFLAELPAADAVVVWSFPEEWYSRTSRLRHVCTPSAGRERVARDPLGRSLAHFGRFHGAIMAESLLAMMLFMNRRLADALDDQRAALWQPTRYEGTRRLAGQTALLVGYGAIGRHAARMLGALGVRVHGLKRRVDQGGQGVERVFGPEQLLQAVALADHVACILPSDTDSDRLFDGHVFERMKRSAYLYNLGRGNAVEESALAAALTTGQIAGAFLDVFAEEPLPASSPLWNLPNLYLTPHASAICGEYLDLYFDELAELFSSER